MSNEFTIANLKKGALASGITDKIDWFILKGPFEGLNGYCIFPRRPTLEQGYDGILAYVPVHGGITFCSQDAKTRQIVYGFDTAHCDSNKYPRSDVEWIKEQIAVMIRGIRLAAKVERSYLRALTNKGKAKWAQRVQDIGAPEQRHNFMVTLNLLSGKL